MLFKKVKSDLKDVEYFKKYIKSLSFGEFINLVTAIVELSQESAKIAQSNTAILGKMKKKNNEDETSRDYYG